MNARKFLLSAIAILLICTASLFCFAACNKNSPPSPSQGLIYELTDFGDEYILTGFGTCTDENVVIAPECEGLPVTAIAKEVFNGITTIKSAIIPDSIATIGDDAFHDCTALERVSMGGGVTSIGNRAFENCTNLKSITVPDRVSHIGEAAFFGCTSLSTASLGYRVSYVGDYAFEGCSSLKSIVIPDRVSRIGIRTFVDCTSLESVTLGGRVESVGDWAFYNCTGLKSITLPASLNYVGYFSFEGCTNLERVYYGGTAEQWDGINIVSSKYYLLNAARYYYSEAYPYSDGVTEGNFWHYVNGKIAIWNK